MGGNPLQMRPDRFPEAKPQQSRQETQEAPKVKGTPTRTELDLTGEDAQTPTTLPPEPGSTPSEPGPSYSEPDPAPLNLAPPPSEPGPSYSEPGPAPRSLALPCREGVWPPRLSTPPPFPAGSQEPSGSLSPSSLGKRAKTWPV